MTQSQTLQRQEKLLSMLSQDGSLSVDDLAQRLRVSVWTVRRDLSKLEERGALRRLHGAAAAMPLGVDSIGATGDANPTGKERIGFAAASRVAPGMHVALSGGSTTLAVARAMKGLGFHGEVVTNALDIALELAEAPGMRVVCTGGEVQARYRTLAGAVTERVLKLHYFDIAIIGVSGIAVPQGFTVNSQVEAATLALMIEHARTVILVADHTKFGRVAFALLPADTPPQLVITDRRPTADHLQALTACGAQVIVA
ncbi:MAG: DeoR/GlpR transcriptional regulator [Anaerolineales bacterium]|nr:DeoR/GlpR transcriptional regulator [Anaerolineales bacterium]